jgi:hypothetical protein
MLQITELANDPRLGRSAHTARIEHNKGCILGPVGRRVADALQRRFEPIWLEAEDDQPADEEEEQEGDESFISFGSSVGLQRELAELAGLLQQAGVPSQSPVARCLLVMRTAADQSVANELPIIVW